MKKIFTIGVYGFKEEEFFNTIISAKIDTFCDIRRRRAVRGTLYSFVNSNKLQNKLIDLGIKYYHFLELSPNPELRAKQKEKDKSFKIKKRGREILDIDFINGYNENNLQNFDSLKFIEQFDENMDNILLFCVERNHDACHRSLLANKLNTDLNIEIIKL